MLNVFRDAARKVVPFSSSRSSLPFATRLSALEERGRQLRQTLADIPERLESTVKVGLGSGLAWDLTRPGVSELLRVLLSGSQNPSLIFRVHGKNSPDKPALVWRDRTTTWGELDARVDRLAWSLSRRGIARGRSVLLMMKNRSEFVETGAAAARVGAAAVSISWRSTAKELAYLANHSGARGIVTEPEFVSVIEAAREELSPEFLQNVIVVSGSSPESPLPPPTLPIARYDDLVARGDRKPFHHEGDDDPAVIIYTSGTTGKPKGAVRKFPKNTMQAAFRIINETPMRTDDRHLVACPLYHSTAFAFMNLALLLGGTIVLMDEFKPEPFLAIVERQRISTTAIVPTMLHRVLELPSDVRVKYDTRTLRAAFSVGAPLPGPVATEFMDAFGDVLFNFYGATEIGLVTLAKPADLRVSPTTIGRAIPGNEIRLVDDEGRDVQGAGVGELFAKNDMLVAGYHQDDDSTRASMLQGYFSVGDLARRDADGRYFIEGRKRDMIISGGVNVYPVEVEQAFESHPDVAEVAVVGVPDREWGERVRAFVVRKEGSDVDDAALKAFARSRLAGPKVPRDIVFVASLPRNPTGKVLKNELRKHDA